MVFKRNKKYRAVLSEVKPSHWMDECPLFIDETGFGLYPVYKTGGPTGRFPKNHQQLILKKIDKKEMF